MYSTKSSDKYYKNAAQGDKVFSGWLGENLSFIWVIK